jgi:hypothetical protein
VRIDKPEIVIARKGFKNNLTTLAKPGQPAAPEPAPVEKPADPKAQAELMQMIKESVLLESFTINDASLRLINLGATTAEPVRISDLDLKITNIGLDRDIVTELSTDTAIDEAGAKVSGPITMHVTKRVVMGAGGFERATFDGKLSFDDLAINAMDAFVKPKGIPLNIAFKGEATPTSLRVDSLQATLHNLEMAAKIDVKDLATLQTAASLSVKNDDLARLGELLPQHKDMLVKATLDVDASIDGPLAQPTGVAGKLALKTKLTGSDLALNVDLKSLEPMRVDAVVASQRLDLGAILKPFMPKDAAPAEKPAPAQPTPAPQAEEPAKDFELTADQKKLLKNADAHVRVTMQQFLFEPVKLDGFVLDMRQRDLQARLDEFAVNGFGGEVRAKGLVDLAPSPIAFEQDFQVNGVRAEELMAIVKPEHKDLLIGKLTLQLAATGQGTSRPTLSKTLNGKGHFSLQDAELHTPSVAAKMQQEFDGFVGGLSIVGAADKTFAEVEKLAANPLLKKIPGGKAPKFDVEKYKAQYGTFKNVNIADKASVDKGMKNVEGDLEIKDGRIYITSVNPTGSGLFDFKGSVGLDMTLAGGAVFAANDALKGKMLKQSKYASLLFDEKQNLNLKMSLGGLVTEPTVKLDLAALKSNFTAKARTLVEAEVKKAAEAQLKSSLGGGTAAIKEQLKQKQAELKQKAKDEVKKKAAAEAQKKGGDKAKEKLKGLFGG